MDKTGVIQAHSKEKLDIYKQYLRNYLSILIQSGWYSQIYIYDVCAGSGKDKNGIDGSALIAAKAIHGYLASKNNGETRLKLFVNELDQKRFKSLNKELSQYNYFVEYSNKNANEFISDQIIVKKPNQKRQNLFFIDPFGYTQYSFKNLFRVASEVRNSEFLIFIPISSVVRFTNSDSKQAEPAKSFLSNVGINGNIESNNDLISKIVNALKQQFKTGFVYSYKLDNIDAHNSVFGLFFISKHIKGAEKYLEAMSKVQESKPQLQLFSADNNNSGFKKFIAISRSNHETYLWAILNEILPKEINATLRGFQNIGVLEVLPSNTRKGSFYNSYKHYKAPIKIHIRYVGE